MLFPHLRKRRFYEAMRQVEPGFDQSLDQRPGRRNEAAPLGTENQPQGACLRQPERFSAAPSLTVVEDQLYAATRLTKCQDLCLAGTEVPARHLVRDRNVWLDAHQGG